MKLNLRRAGRTRETEEAFSLTLIVVVLLILPSFGGTAMLVGSAIGLAAYIFLFPGRFRSRSGSLTRAICFSVALALAAAAAVAVSLWRGHWY